MKLSARLRARGPGEVLGLAGERLRDVISSDDTLVFFARTLSSQSPPDAARPGLRFRPATAEDGPRYAREVGTDSARSFRARLSGTTRCFLVERDQMIVHASWVTTAAAWTRELRRYFRAPPGDAYIYESFTRREARGQGVYPFALEKISKRLENEGITRVWVGVEADNPSSAKAVKKAGFEPGFELSYTRRMGRIRVGTPEGPLVKVCGSCLQE